MTESPSYSRTDVGDGEAVFLVGYDEDDTLSSIEQKLSRDAETPTPSDGEGGSDGGPVRRFTDRFTAIGGQHLRRLALQGHEILDAVRVRRDELYRNEFPVIKPRFGAKCEACGSEFDTVRDDCSNCGNDELRRPDPAEKREAERLFESVNREGQSLREVAKAAEPDQWLSGVSTLIIRYDYAVATESDLVDAGTILNREVDEIVRADPLTVVPVVDENGRIGGHMWACPIHRDETDHKPGHCSRCGAEMRDVYYIQHEAGGDKTPYFENEVISWAYPFPRLGGLDGLAPAAAVWLRQAILDMMDRYGAAYYDTDSDRLPNQFMILHTTNPDHWEEELSKARDDDDPYDAPIFSNAYSPQDSSTPEVQVIDAMPDELLGQNQAIKQDYKEDIRQAFGISNVHDSDLSDAGGLNNEGLQLEVTDRSIASQQHDYIEGWLDELAKRVGLEDWRIEFLPAREEEPDALDLQRTIRSGQLAAEAGLDVSWHDGDIEIANGEFQPPPDPEPGAEPAGGEGEQAGDGPPSAQSFGAQLGAGPGQAAATLAEAFDHLVRVDDISQAADPFWGEDEDVPANVENRIREAVRATDFRDTDRAPASGLSQYFEAKLTQRQGWSLDSLTEGLVEQFDLGRDYAQTVARSKSSEILTKAKTRAFEDLEQGAGEEVLYYWDGPQGPATTEACQELKELTNPEYGGEPRPKQEFDRLLRDIHDKHFPDLSFRGDTLHPNERHTVEAGLATQFDIS